MSGLICRNNIVLLIPKFLSSTDDGQIYLKQRDLIVADIPQV